MGHKKGIYETFYGNSALWDGGEVAYDLDMMEVIPASEVNFDRFVREVEESDRKVKSECVDWFGMSFKEDE